MPDPLDFSHLPPNAGETGDAEITEEELDAAEEEVAAEEASEEREDLGVFDEKDYAARIEGWDFKSEDRDVGDDTIAVYYRRRWDAPGGTKWERLGHERSPDALDLKRLVHCADKRDLRAKGNRERRELIESLFGPGALPVVDSLLAARSGEGSAAASPGPLLTQRQEAFCRNFLTEPNATRAAILAGYGEAGAAVEAHRMLRNAKILARITTLRREKGLTYCFDRDSLLDRLEWVFGEAMEGRDYSTAIRALLAQAQMFGIDRKRHAGTERAEANARAEAEAAAPASATDGTR